MSDDTATETSTARQIGVGVSASDEEPAIVPDSDSVADINVPVLGTHAAANSNVVEGEVKAEPQTATVTTSMPHPVGTQEDSESVHKDEQENSASPPTSFPTNLPPSLPTQTPPATPPGNHPALSPPDTSSNTPPGTPSASNQNKSESGPDLQVQSSSLQDTRDNSEPPQPIKQEEQEWPTHNRVDTLQTTKHGQVVGLRPVTPAPTLAGVPRDNAGHIIYHLQQRNAPRRQPPSGSQQVAGLGVVYNQQIGGVMRQAQRASMSVPPPQGGAPAGAAYFQAMIQSQQEQIRRLELQGAMIRSRLAATGGTVNFPPLVPSTASAVGEPSGPVRNLQQQPNRYRSLAPMPPQQSFLPHGGLSRQNPRSLTPVSLHAAESAPRTKRKRPVVESDDDAESSENENEAKAVLSGNRARNIRPKDKQREEVNISDDEDSDFVMSEDKSSDDEDITIKDNKPDDQRDIAMDDDESDDEPLVNRVGKRRSESHIEAPPEKNSDIPPSIVPTAPTNSSSAEKISWKLPAFEITVQPPNQDEDVEIKISIPGCIRESLILSHDHASQELHLFRNPFLPGQEALEQPDEYPLQAILNFHNICVMILDAYHAHLDGDLEVSAKKDNPASDDESSADGDSDSDEQSEPVQERKSAQEVDPDDIFFAALDRWRTGLAEGQRDIMKPAYAHIRGAQEFCDIAFDIIYYIKEHGMVDRDLIPGKVAPSNKDVKTPAKRDSKGAQNTKKSADTPKTRSATKKTPTTGGKTAGRGTKSNPHQPSSRKKVKPTPRKEKLGGISVITTRK